MKKVIIFLLTIALAVAACGCKVNRNTTITSSVKGTTYVSEYVNDELRNSYTINYN